MVFDHGVHNVGSLEANEKIDFYANARTGSLVEPFNLTFDKFGFENSSSLQVFPNPFTEHLSMNLLLNEKQKVEIRLFNSIGVLVSISTLEMEKGSQEINIFKQLNLNSTLGKGIYVIKVKMNGTENIIKVVKN